MPVSAVTRGGCVTRQLGIEERDAERGLLVAAGHLHVRLGVGDERERLRLAAGAGGRRHGDHRQHRPRGLADAPVVLHPAAVGVEEVDALGAVHRAAAAEADDQVGIEAAWRTPAPASTWSVVGFSADAVEQLRLDAGLVAATSSPRCGMAGRDDARVADDQRPPCAELAGQARRARRSCRAEDDPRARLEVERNHASRGESGGGIVGSADCSRVTTFTTRRAATTYCARPVAPSAIWNARARNRKSTMFPSCGCSQFELDRRDRADVQPVDVRRVGQLRCWNCSSFGDRRADQRRADLLEHLVLRALDDGGEREHVFLLGDRRCRATSQCMIVGRR